MRAPKDLHKYIDSKIAFGRLVHLAMEHILFIKKGIRVKWELTIRYYQDPKEKDPNDKTIARVVSSKFGSGTVDPE